MRSKKSISENDLAIRYGGDEFIAISLNTEETYWPGIRSRINDTMRKEIIKQRLPYEPGVSLGYAISNKENPLSFRDSLNIADSAMYTDKQQRKNNGQSYSERI
ncbi:MAG: diguanylate cyclase [Lachnospiraceae bacterium]|nr:diguanylate cyclase [Lachnospiraceae bacterium]